MTIVIPVRAAQRARESYWLDLLSGCHVSTYSAGSHGYAQIGWHEDGQRVATTAHRAAWVAAHGQISDGMTVDHLCKNRRCVNVLHLRLLSNFENARRTDGRNWPLGQCIHGHPNSSLTTWAGKRVCRECRNIRQRAYRERRRASA